MLPRKSNEPLENFTVIYNELKNLAAIACLTTTLSQLVGACIAAEPAKPNVLLIMIDDMGWMDLRCQGNERLHTPNIDRLASQGMRFTDAYAAAPVCS